MEVKEQLQNEFLKNSPELAINVLKPLYEMNIRDIAKMLEIPARAINSDSSPTNIANNQKYFENFNYKIISGTGHYPMLEKPNEFNKLLDEILEEIK